MTNLTISLDDTIVRDARIKAIQEGTSVSAKVREFLRAYVAGDSVDQLQADQVQASHAQARQIATARLMQTIANAGKASKAEALDAGEAAASRTLRSTLYADGFRQLDRDVALAGPIVPESAKPGA